MFIFKPLRLISIVFIIFFIFYFMFFVLGMIKILNTPVPLPITFIFIAWMFSVIYVIIDNKVYVLDRMTMLSNHVIEDIHRKINNKTSKVIYEMVIIGTLGIFVFICPIFYLLVVIMKHSIKRYGEYNLVTYLWLLKLKNFCIKYDIIRDSEAIEIIKNFR